MMTRAGSINIQVPYALALLVAAFALVWQRYLGLNPDTTWLTLMAERWLGGGRLYVDLHENNPPASVYLYVPAALAGKWTGLRSELILQVMTIGCFALCAAAAWRMLVRAGYGREFRYNWLALIATMLFLVLPVSSFAQREHLAAILTLPVIGVGIIRSNGRQPLMWMVVVSGLCMGIVASIKPPLVSIAILVALIGAIANRSWRPVFAAENWIAAGVFASYIAAIFFVHPEFVRDVMPLLREVYLPNGFMLALIILPAFYVIAAAIFHSVMMHKSDWLEPPMAIVYAAAAGYFFSYVLQMKFFDYHALPVSIFLLLALAMGSLRLKPDAKAGETYMLPFRHRFMTLAVVAVLAGFNVWDFDFRQYNGNLTRVVASIKSGAKVVGFGIYPGPQIRSVRDAGGHWVGSFGYTYVPGFAAWYYKHETVSPAWAKRLDYWERWTAEVFARDLKAKKPEIVLMRDEVLVRWPEWIRKYPQLDGAMKDYDFYRKVNVGKKIFPVLIYVRKFPHAGGPRGNTQ